MSTVKQYIKKISLPQDSLVLELNKIRGGSKAIRCIPGKIVEEPPIKCILGKY